MYLQGHKLQSEGCHMPIVSKVIGLYGELTKKRREIYDFQAGHFFKIAFKLIVLEYMRFIFSLRCKRFLFLSR